MSVYYQEKLKRNQKPWKTSFSVDSNKIARVCVLLSEVISVVSSLDDNIELDSFIVDLFVFKKYKLGMPKFLNTFNCFRFALEVHVGKK